MKGDGKNNTLRGTVGDDYIYGYGGADIIIGGRGNDILSGGAGKDRFVLDSRDWGNDTVTDWGKGDRVDVSALNITSFAIMQKLLTAFNYGVGFGIRNNGQASSIFLENTDISTITAKSFVFSTSKKALNVKGAAGDDTLFGANGDDVINPGAGSDLIAGGGGKDTFVFDRHGFGYDTILDFQKGDRIDLSAFHISDLASLRAVAQGGGTGTSISLYAAGQSGTIVLEGRGLASLSASSFVFDTSGKAVKTVGSDAPDTLFGGTGNDTLSGGGSYDVLCGGAGDDVLDAGPEGGRLYLGKGNDTVAISQRFPGTIEVHDFGSGDKIDLSRIGVGDFSAIEPFFTQSSPTEVLLSLGVGFGLFLEDTKLRTIDATDFIFDKDARPRTIEGSAYDDFLFGGAGADTLNGGNGYDVMSGGAGRDRLIGSAGADRLYGGDGADTFVYTDIADSRPYASGEPDRIMDFSHAQGDRLDLSALDAIADTAKDDKFHFIGTKAFTGAAGELRYEVIEGSAHIYANTLDHPAAPYQVEIVVEGVTALKANDFVL